MQAKKSLRREPEAENSQVQMQVWRRYHFADYSTVTDLARFLGWSTLQPRLTAT
jgi:hypothetical protein